MTALRGIYDLLVFIKLFFHHAPHDVIVSIALLPLTEAATADVVHTVVRDLIESLQVFPAVAHTGCCGGFCDGFTRRIPGTSEVYRADLCC